MIGCVLPPELTDIQLWTFLDGQAGQDIKMHLDRCAYCRKRVDQLAAFQKHMTAMLHRLDCPTSMELGEYHLDLLSGEAAEKIHRHLEECPYCSQEIEQLKNFLGEVASDLKISFTEKVKVLVAQLISSSNQGIQPGITPMSMAFAGLRGEQAAPLVYQVESFQISVQAHDDPETTGFRILLGLVTGIGSDVWQVRLLQENKAVKNTIVDNLGNFVIFDLAPGLYQLLLTNSEIEIYIENLVI